MKKSILIVDNGIIAKKENLYFVNSDTNHFINDLCALNIDVSIMQFVSQIKSTSNILGSKVDVPIVKLLFYNKNFLYKLFSYFNASFKIIKSIHKFDFIYIFFPGFTSYITLLICLLFRKKYGIYVRGDFDSSRFFNKIILTKASLLVTNNLLFKRKINPLNNKCHIIISYKRLGNVIPEIKFNIKKDHNILRVLFVGRIEKSKGVNELIEGCLNVYSRNKNFRLDVIGGGDLFEHYSKCKDQNLDFIEFHGPIDNRERIDDFYKKSDIFILPTYTEAFPRVLYDAMRFNVAVITTFVGGIESVFVDNYNCLKIKTQSSKSIVEKLQILLNNKKLRLNISKNSFFSLKKLFIDYNISHKVLIKNYLNNL